MRLFVFLAALLCSIQALVAQNILQGSVYDLTTGEPLIGVNVVLDNQTGTTTNRLGSFRIATDPGNDTLQLSFIGYESITQPIDDSQANEPLNIYLKPGSVELADIIVSSGESLLRKTISAYDINLRPIQTSQDVLRQVPGLFIAQHAGGGKAEQIFLRGFDIDHGTDINLTVDGLPVNMVSHAHGQGYSDLHFVIPETIKQVDFGLGSHDASIGDFATAGYAAFETVDVLDQSSIKLEGGQFNTLRTVAMINLLNKERGQIRQNGYLAGELFRSDGYFESPQDFLRLNLLGKYNLLVKDRTRLTASFSTFGSRWDASGQIPVRAVESGRISRFGAIDDTEGGTTRRTNANLQLTQSVGNRGTLTNQLYFTRYDFDLFSNFTFFLNDPIRGDQIRQSETRNIYGYRGSYSLNHRVAGMDGLTEVGVGFRYDDVQDVRLSRTQNRVTRLSDLSRGDVEQANASAWVRHTLDLTSQLSVSAGLRYDYFHFSYRNALATAPQNQSQAKGIWSPKLNVNYQLNDRIQLFAKASTGFHSNDARVVVAQQGQEILPRAYGADVGAIFKPLPNLLVNTTAWWLNLDQEFVYVGDEGIVEAGGKTRRRGIDLALRYQLRPWLYLDADLNVTDPRALNAPEGQHYIPLAPVLTSIGGVGFKFPNGINARLNYRFLGDRPANEDYSLTAEGYFLMDAKVTYSVSRYEFGLTAENIFNQNWREAQFETESRLLDEPEPVSEIHFTPGTPFFLRASVKVNFGSR